MSAPQQGGEDYLDKAVDKAEQMIGTLITCATNAILALY